MNNVDTISEPKKKQYEISVLVVKSGLPFVRNMSDMEEMLDYVGLSGGRLRKMVENPEQAIIEMRHNKYDIVVGDGLDARDIPQGSFYSSSYPAKLDGFRNMPEGDSKKRLTLQSTLRQIRESEF